MICQIKKIMVCDEDKLFFNYFKKYFFEYDFVYYTDRELYEEYDMIIFVANKSLDCLEFLDVKYFQVPVLVAVFDEVNFYLKCEFLGKGVVKFFKIDKTKIMEVKNEIKVYFETNR